MVRYPWIHIHIVYVTFYCVQTRKTVKVKLDSAQGKKLHLTISRTGNRVTRLIKYTNAGQKCSRIVSEEDSSLASSVWVRKGSLRFLVKNWSPWASRVRVAPCPARLPSRSVPAPARVPVRHDRDRGATSKSRGRLVKSPGADMSLAARRKTARAIAASPETHCLKNPWGPWRKENPPRKSRRRQRKPCLARSWDLWRRRRPGSKEKKLFIFFAWHQKTLLCKLGRQWKWSVRPERLRRTCAVHQLLPHCRIRNNIPMLFTFWVAHKIQRSHIDGRTMKLCAMSLNHQDAGNTVMHYQLFETHSRTSVPACLRYEIDCTAWWEFRCPNNANESVHHVLNCCRVICTTNPRQVAYVLIPNDKMWLISHRSIASQSTSCSVQ